jgi:hypothetical protein
MRFIVCCDRITRFNNMEYNVRCVCSTGHDSCKYCYNIDDCEKYPYLLYIGNSYNNIPMFVCYDFDILRIL